MPKAPGIGASEPTATDGAVRRPRLARERSLTEMMSISDWYWFVPETIGLLLLIALFRAVLPAGASGVGMPHPFWIPVLLMSGQYGIMGGLFATLAASAALFVSGLPPQSAAQDFYAYAGVVAAQPCGWFATALITGGPAQPAHPSPDRPPGAARSDRNGGDRSGRRPGARCRRDRTVRAAYRHRFRARLQPSSTVSRNSSGVTDDRSSPASPTSSATASAQPVL